MNILGQNRTIHSPETFKSCTGVTTPPMQVALGFRDSRFPNVTEWQVLKCVQLVIDLVMPKRKSSADLLC